MLALIVRRSAAAATPRARSSILHPLHPLRPLPSLFCAMSDAAPVEAAAPAAAEEKEIILDENGQPISKR